MLLRALQPLLGAPRPCCRPIPVHARALASLARSKRPWNLRRPHQQKNQRRDDVHLDRHVPLVPQALEPTVQAWLAHWGPNEPTLRAGIINLRSDVWTMPLRPDIVHRVVHWQLQSRRPKRGIGKSRGEVRGGGRKPRPQKGTGKSRQGSIRVPHYRGGGVAHPRRPRDFSYPLNRKVVNLGMRVVLSDKYRRGSVIFVNETRTEDHTKQTLLERLAMLGIQGNDGHRVLIVGSNDSSDRGQKLMKTASAGLHVFKRPWVHVIQAKHVNVLAMLRYEVLLIGLDGLRDLERRFPRPPALPTPPEIIELPVVPEYLEPPNIRMSMRADE